MSLVYDLQKITRMASDPDAGQLFRLLCRHMIGESMRHFADSISPEEWYECSAEYIRAGRITGCDE